jgi:hypothetical protein
MHVDAGFPVTSHEKTHSSFSPGNAQGAMALRRLHATGMHLTFLLSPELAISNAKTHPSQGAAFICSATAGSFSNNSLEDSGRVFMVMGITLVSSFSGSPVLRPTL